MDQNLLAGEFEQSRVEGDDCGIRFKMKVVGSSGSFVAEYSR